MKRLMPLGILTLAALATHVAEAAKNIWYADDDNYDATCATYADYVAKGKDGTSEAKAFGTIQAAVNQAASGDEIVVLPGTYDKGRYWGSYCGWSRLGIASKKLYVHSVPSRGGKTTTFLVGAVDEETGGLGTNAMRCVYLDSGAAGTIVEGLTLCGGALADKSNETGRGAAAFSNGSATSALVDCVISNTLAAYSTVFQVACVRCEIVGNRCAGVTAGNNYGHTYGSPLVNCLMHNNYGGGALVYSGAICNTTLSGNKALAWGCRNGTKAYNSVVEVDSTSIFYQPGETNSVAVNNYPLLAPALQDFHPYAGGAADGAGLAENLAKITLPEGVNRYIDIEGRAIPTNGPVTLGCYQTTKARAAAGGRLRFACSGYDSVSGVPLAPLSIDGAAPITTWTYLYPTVYPTQYVVSVAWGAPLVYATSSSGGIKTQAPDLDGKLAIMPTQGLSDMVTITPYSANAELYVAMTGSDETGDGSLAKPYATIQKAVDAAGGASTNTLIHVAAGTYGGAADAHYPVQGTTEQTKFGKASVTVCAKHVRIVADKGPERTVILGATDSDYATDEDLPGCGPNAARCVILVNPDTTDDGSSVSGFTLTGGATGRSGSDYSIWGGGYLCAYSHGAITDCIVSNNAGHTCAGGWGGRIQRCLFTDNKGLNGTAGYSAALMASFFGCIFRDNPASRNAKGALYCGYAAHCTFIGEDASYPVAENTSWIDLANCILVGGEQNCTYQVRNGNILWNGSSPDTRASEIVADPLFVDAANDDYRVKSASLARYAGVLTSAYYALYSSTGFDGRRLTFTDGIPLAGACQEVVAADSLVYFSATKGGISCGDYASDTAIEMPAGGSITFAPATSTRPCAGYRVNGEDFLFSSLSDTAGQLTLSADQVAAYGGCNVSALYTTNWYVNADATLGNDANPGCATLPRLTLAGAAKDAISGDVIHAARGDYNTGLMLQADDCCISSRVVVASGVTLVADEGPNCTFITGGDSPQPINASNYSTRDYMSGPGAVRCVFLQTNAKVKGFTIHNGRFNGQSPDTSDSRSGGVYGADLTSIAENCIITNCSGYRGGATYRCLAVNCRIEACRSNGGTGGRNSSFIGCVFGKQLYGDGAFDYVGARGAHSCTFLSPTTSFSTHRENAAIRNSIILPAFGTDGAYPLALHNCLISREAIENMNEITQTNVTFYSCVTNMTRAEILAMLNDDGTPKATATAIIDQGDTASLRSELGGVDRAGNPRVSNGALDLGAFEYDWRPIYGATLCPDVCTVSFAESETVLAADGKSVEMTGTLKATLANPNGASSARYVIPFEVTGNGTLTVLVNGKSYGPYETGAYNLKFRSTTASNAITFVYTPGENDDGLAELKAMTASVQGLVLLLK